ncbi:hypothetical protein E2562_022342 [Oryza meyeriana var. granulata]|uniref:DUF4219 domain-containing protein n=1 Tax=Oryza meyeriana var. granulata TaxID=110450 RepID=A0A6G1DLT8_9ORYZ|nr:hypothetical protein E2562_022342 [Oryza meyeriana var. granulata]
MKMMPRDDSSPSKAIVNGGFSDSTMTATAMTGRLPFPMLTRTNYVAWALRMKYLLRTNGAWGAIDPEKASGTIDESKDQLALTIISQSIDDKTLLRVAEKETASDSMDDFAAKFTALVGRIRELGDAMDEKYVVKKLLRAVSTKFVNVASSLMLFSDINKMAMEEAIGSLKAYEELLKGRETRLELQEMLGSEKAAVEVGYEALVLVLEYLYSSRVHLPVKAAFHASHKTKNSQEVSRK